MLWNHSVRSLTQGRLDSRVLNPDYLDRLWDYVKNSFDKSLYYSSALLDDLVYEDWKKFGETLYGVRRPEELKVAFLCGPEPENDVNHLVRLGVRIENIYAFENDKTSLKKQLIVCMTVSLILRYFEVIYWIFLVLMK